MLETYLVQSCKLVTTSYNEWGDQIFATESTLACRFREINAIDRATHQALLDTDAMIWLAPTVNVDKGSIILFDDTYYEVKKVVFARRLGDADIEFIKCELQIIDLAIS